MNLTSPTCLRITTSRCSIFSLSCEIRGHYQALTENQTVMAQECQKKLTVDKTCQAIRSMEGEALVRVPWSKVLVLQQDLSMLTTCRISLQKKT